MQFFTPVNAILLKKHQKDKEEVKKNKTLMILVRSIFIYIWN